MNSRVGGEVEVTGRIERGLMGLGAEFGFTLGEVRVTEDSE